IVARGDFRGQAHQVFGNLQKALAAAGGSLKDLAKITVYVTDPRYRDPLREVQDQYLSGALPASTLLVVAAMAEPDYLIEIVAVAVLGAGSRRSPPGPPSQEARMRSLSPGAIVWLLLVACAPATAPPSQPAAVAAAQPAASGPAAVAPPAATVPPIER